MPSPPPGTTGLAAKSHESRTISAFSRQPIPVQIGAVLEKLDTATNVRNALRLLAQVIDSDRELAAGILRVLSLIQSKPPLVVLVLQNAAAYLEARDTP